LDAAAGSGLLETRWFRTLSVEDDDLLVLHSAWLDVGL
jgi:hypothetical protein